MNFQSQGKWPSENIARASIFFNACYPFKDKSHHLNKLTCCQTIQSFTQGNENVVQRQLVEPA